MLAIPTPFLGYSILLFFLISGFCIHYPHAENQPSQTGKHIFTDDFGGFTRHSFLPQCCLHFGYFCYVYWNDPSWNLSSHWRIATLLQNYPPNNGQYLPNPSLWTIP